jgi:hypothetical protein
LHPIFFSIEFEFNLNAIESCFNSIQGACNVIYIWMKLSFQMKMNFFFLSIN